MYRVLLNLSLWNSFFEYIKNKRKTIAFPFFKLSSQSFYVHEHDSFRSRLAIPFMYLCFSIILQSNGLGYSGTTPCNLCSPSEKCRLYVRVSLSRCMGSRISQGVPDSRKRSLALHSRYIILSLCIQSITSVSSFQDYLFFD